MKEIFILTDGDWLQEIATTKKELKKLFFENWKTRWNLDHVKDYVVEKITYDGKKFWYDRWYWDFRMYEKWLTDIDNMEHVIEYDDYDDYWIICKELKKDFLYINQ